MFVQTGSWTVAIDCCHDSCSNIRLDMTRWNVSVPPEDMFYEASWFHVKLKQIKNVLDKKKTKNVLLSSKLILISVLQQSHSILCLTTCVFFFFMVHVGPLLNSLKWRRTYLWFCGTGYKEKADKKFGSSNKTSGHFNQTLFSFWPWKDIKLVKFNNLKTDC